MWKLLMLAMVLMHLGKAQRSSYAARPRSRSKLLPRFRKNETESNLVSRGGEENEFSSTTLNPELQGTLEDHEFVYRVSQWPEERQPFWYKNRKAISSMRGREIDGGDITSSFNNNNNNNNNNQKPQSPFRSPFQGSSRGRGVGLSMDLNESRGGGRNNAAFAFDNYYSDSETNPLLLYLQRLNNR